VSPHAVVLKVVVVSGHMVDAPDRPVERFPARQVEAVTTRVREILAEWGVDGSTTVICGGARGADILVAEEAMSRGAHVRVCLALDPDDFERESVEIAGTDWSHRYRDLLAHAEVTQVDQPAPDGQEFARANQFMVTLAKSLDPSPYAIFIWDGQSADGPGGTADLVNRLGYTLTDPRIRIINPTSVS